MKLALQIIFSLVVFVAADHLRSVLQRQFHSSNTQSFVLASVAVYLLVFAVAGAVMAVVASRSSVAVALAALVGAASPLSTLPFEPMQPFYWSTHAPAWLEPLFWAHWYVPPVAAVLGSLIVLGVRARVARTHAA